MFKNPFRKGASALQIIQQLLLFLRIWITVQVSDALSVIVGYIKKKLRPRCLPHIPVEVRIIVKHTFFAEAEELQHLF